MNEEERTTARRQSISMNCPKSPSGLERRACLPSLRGLAGAGGAAAAGFRRRQALHSRLTLCWQNHTSRFDRFAMPFSLTLIKCRIG